MTQYDTHVVFFSLDDLEKVRGTLGEKCSKVLGHDSEVLGSTQIPCQTAMFTKGYTSRTGAAQNHKTIVELIGDSGIPALVETEHNFSLVGLVDKSPQDDDISDYQLNNQQRTPFRLHFGDTHLYIPINPATRELREAYRQLGYQHIILSNDRWETPYAVVTSQPESRDVLQLVVKQIAQVAKRYGFEITGDNLKGERLMYFNCFGGVQPLPITVGMKQGIH